MSLQIRTGRDHARNRDSIGDHICGLVQNISAFEDFGEGSADRFDARHQLFSIGAILATPQGKAPRGAAALPTRRVQALEGAIDLHTARLPKLKNFILPGGSSAGAALHVARSVCRRAERSVIGLSQKERVAPEVVVYLNRLSDCLFTLARAANRAHRSPETIWKQT